LPLRNFLLSMQTMDSLSSRSWNDDFDMRGQVHRLRQSAVLISGKEAVV